MSGMIPAIAALAAFLICFFVGVPAIPLLKRLKFGQTIREEGPDWHKAKEGTPTMGGIMIAIGVAVGVAVGMGISKTFGGDLSYEFAYNVSFTKLFAGLGLAFGMGLIGFIDDYIKVVKKRNLGLTASQKTFLQALVTVAYLISLALAGVDTTYLPFVGEISVVNGFGILFWPIAFFFIYGFTNAVNLTDGIDGLASSVTLVVSVAFMLIAGTLDMLGCNIIAASLAGACIGFLAWNWHPAKIFMGDTGSMFLGGMVVALAFCIDRPIYLLLMGIVYLIEALSVMLQVFWFKKTGKRLFKMSPIHHHFEKSGWSEVKIVIIFSLVTLVACGICFAAVKYF
ncbi:MAG: phospho-N-acetylmuramoyl-pentapeptide-transferase [Clostridia bacterium]|nr:phospho-N-acetylmuramoyl-pentapeptide-transferase [Clostridia bacterium]